MCVICRTLITAWKHMKKQISCLWKHKNSFYFLPWHHHHQLEIDHCWIKASLECNGTTTIPAFNQVVAALCWRPTLCPLVLSVVLENFLGLSAVSSANDVPPPLPLEYGDFSGYIGDVKYNFNYLCSCQVTTSLDIFPPLSILI